MARLQINRHACEELARSRRRPAASGPSRVELMAVGGRLPSREVMGHDAKEGESGRVDLGGRPPRPPTDPDVRVKRIWLFIS